MICKTFAQNYNHKNFQKQNFAANSSLASSLCHRHTDVALNCRDRDLQNLHPPQPLSHKTKAQHVSSPPWNDFLCWAPPGLVLLCQGRACGSCPVLGTAPSRGAWWAATQLLFLGLQSFSTARWLLLFTYLMWIQGTLCSSLAQLPGSRTAERCLSAFWHNAWHLPFPYAHARIFAPTQNVRGPNFICSYRLTPKKCIIL